MYPITHLSEGWFSINIHVSCSFTEWTLFFMLLVPLPFGNNDLLFLLIGKYYFFLPENEFAFLHLKKICSYFYLSFDRNGFWLGWKKYEKTLFIQGRKQGQEEHASPWVYTATVPAHPARIYFSDASIKIVGIQRHHWHKWKSTEISSGKFLRFCAALGPKTDLLGQHLGMGFCSRKLAKFSIRSSFMPLFLQRTFHYLRAPFDADDSESELVLDSTDSK